MRPFRSGILALGAIGLFMLWRNRFQVQRFFSSYGVDLPLGDGSLSDNVRSGLARISGRVQGKARDTSSDVREAV